MAVRVGIDTGGTFTDLVALDDATGDARVLKVMTTPSDPAIGVLAAIGEARSVFALDPGEISMLVEGSTTAINTVIQHSGARVGLLVTRGFRDVLELGRLRLPRVNDFYAQRPPPLVARARVLEVEERMDRNGVALRLPDLPAIVNDVRRLVAGGVDAIAVAFLHSFRNPAHEAAVAGAIRESLPGLFVTASSEIWPVRGEYERTMVAVVNAYIGERMRDHIESLESGAVGLGVDATMLATKSNGGVVDASAAAERPVETLLSGPAAGVVAAHAVMGAKGWPAAVSLDMGGTTADVALIMGEIPFSYNSAAGDFPIVVPSVDVHSIGAGGGSIVWRDQAGVLKVGPRSAGADPGPACYGAGGRLPTVTDAYVALGMIPDGVLLGGQVTIRRDLAEAALAEIGASPESVLDVATSNMAARLMPLAAAAGVEVSTLPLIAYGGAGPTHACLLAREVGMAKVLIPTMPGAMCALGAVLADLRVDFVRALSTPCDDEGVELVRKAVAGLEEQARAWLAAQRVKVTTTTLKYAADMRFKGQSFEIAVPLGVSELRSGATAIHEAFCARYQAVYGHVEQGRRSELVNLRLQLVGHLPTPLPRHAAATGSFQPPRSAIPVHHRDHLTGPLAGPAIVLQYDTTTFIPAGARLHVDQAGNLEIDL